MISGIIFMQLPPPPPRVKLCGWEGVGGVESCWRLPYILQEFTLCTYVTRFRTYKIAISTQDKNLEGERASNR